MCPAVMESGFDDEKPSDCEDIDGEFYSDMLNFGRNKINTLDKSGNSSLHHAIIKGSLELCEKFLEIGADLDLPTKSGDSSIHLAVKNDKLAISKLLLQKGADPNVISRSRETPLMLAIIGQSTKIISLLLNHGADISKLAKYEPLDKFISPLALLLYMKNSHALTIVIRHVNYRHNTKMTLDEIILFYDDVSAFEMLEQFKAANNTDYKQNDLDLTFLAAKFNSIKCFKYILDKHPNTKPGSNEGFKIAPIHVASQKGM